jgi:hypothetical protein
MKIIIHFLLIAYFSFSFLFFSFRTDRCDGNGHYLLELNFEEDGFFCAAANFYCDTDSLQKKINIFSCCCVTQDKNQIIKVGKAQWKESGKILANKNIQKSIKKFEKFKECSKGVFVSVVIGDKKECQKACWWNKKKESIFCLDSFNYINKILTSNCKLEVPQLYGSTKVYFSEPNQQKAYLEILENKPDMVRELFRDTNLCVTKTS